MPELTNFAGPATCGLDTAPWPAVTLFAGPTAHGLDPAPWLDDGVTLQPPARRGDIDRLTGASCESGRQPRSRRRGAPRAPVAQQEPGVIVLCDGVFGVAPAVSHAELCRALDAGWQLWGTASLGAIRAWELRAEGMRGFGEVYAQFARHGDFRDDEMALLHFPEAPYFPVSEALVNLRHAFEARGAALGIAAEAGGHALAALSQLWFGERTEARMRSAMVEGAGIDADAADQLLAWLRTNRIKSLDLERLMALRPWRG